MSYQIIWESFNPIFVFIKLLFQIFKNNINKEKKGEKQKKIRKRNFLLNNLII
jgi:hypothetical protein